MPPGHHKPMPAAKCPPSPQELERFCSQRQHTPCSLQGQYTKNELGVAWERESDLRPTSEQEARVKSSSLPRICLEMR